MSEAKIIPTIPPVEDAESKITEQPKPPKAETPSAPKEVVSTVDSKEISPQPTESQTVTVESPPVATPPETSAVNTVDSIDTVGVPDDIGMTDNSGNSITYLQGVTYASFVLIFCLAGFAAIVVFRKSLKASVKRFSTGAKMLSLAYLIMAIFGSFGTYVYSRFLNGGETVLPLIVPMLSWVLVGPAIATVLNFLLTRDDMPSAKKIFLDAFIFLFIFGSVTASLIPSFKASGPLVLSFLGIVFFLFPIVRFSASMKTAKVVHPELREMFVQILVYSLLFLPILLPLLAFTNAYGLVADGLSLLLFNSVILAFVLITGLLMIIAIDYVTQGISPDQLVTQKTNAPVAPFNLELKKQETPPAQPRPSAESVSPVIPKVQKIQETSKPILEKPEVASTQKSEPAEKEASVIKKSQPEEPASPVAPEVETIEKPAEPKPAKPVTPEVKKVKEPTEPLIEEPVEKESTASADISSSDTSKSSDSSEKTSAGSEELSEIDEFDVDKDDSTIINFDNVKSSAEKSNKNLSIVKKPKLGNQSKKPNIPKAPQPPNTSKSNDSKSNIKPPEKPKKRF